MDPPSNSGAPPTEPSSESSSTRNYKLPEARVGSSRSEAGAGLGAGLSHSSSSSSGGSGGTKNMVASSSQEIVTGTRGSSRSHHHHHHTSTTSTSTTGQQGGVAGREGAGQRVEELERRLEEVTQERDTLRAREANHDRVQALLQSRIKRLEQQLVSPFVVRLLSVCCLSVCMRTCLSVCPCLQ